MANPQADFRECYRHPGKPAIRNCKRCRKPMCKLCSREVDGSWFCEACAGSIREEKAAGGKRGQKSRGGVGGTQPRGAPSPVLPIPPPLEPASSLVVSEVTIHEDGSVEAPVVAGPKTPVERKEHEPELKTPDAGTVPAPAHDVTSEEARALDDAIEKARRLERPAAAAPPAKAPAGKKPAAVKRASRPGRRREKVKETGAPGVAKPAREKKPSRAAAALRSDHFKQVMSSLPYGIVAAVAVFGFWMIFAVVKRQWTQTAVLTAGMVIPWAVYNGSTARKRMGKKVWRGKPAPIWTGVVSACILALFFPIAEFLAFRFVMRGTILGWREFSIKYFKTADWVMIICGFALALGIPFLLRIGQGWKTPRIPSKKKGEKTESPEKPLKTPEKPPASS